MSSKKLPPGWDNQNGKVKPNWANKDSLANGWNNSVSNSNKSTDNKGDFNENISEEIKNITSDKSEQIVLKEENTVSDEIVDVVYSEVKDIVVDEPEKTILSPVDDIVVEKAENIAPKKSKKIVKKKKKSLKILVVVLIMLLIIAITALVVLAYLYFSDKRLNSNSKLVESTTVEVVETTTVEPTTIPDTTVIETITAEETTTTEEVATTNNENMSTDGISVSTEYYTITLPSWWKGKYGYEIYETEGYGYSLTVYHKQSKEEYYGGELFSISLIPHDSRVPMNSVYLGDLSVYRINDFYIYALFPTDVQYPESVADEYLEMQDKVNNILLTICPGEESEFTPVDWTEAGILKEELE